MDIIKVMETFRSQEDCIAYLEHLRFNSHPHCTHCMSENVMRSSEKYRWRCRDCKSSYNVLSGTIFSGTKTPLIKWFLAISLMIKFKKGISSYTLAETLNISQDNAWRMQDKMRQEMYNEMNETLIQGITGTAEMDETYARIKSEYQHSTWTDTVAILGVTSRDGKVVSRRVYSKDNETMQWFASQYLDLNNSILITDQWRGYNRMNEIVEHEFLKRDKYGRFINDIHTNRIESFWAIYKRSLTTYHHYSENRIDQYLAEIAFRYNRRHFSREEVFKYFIKCCLFKHVDMTYHLIHNSWLL